MHCRKTNSMFVVQALHRKVQESFALSTPEACSVFIRENNLCAMIGLGLLCFLSYLLH